MQGCTNPKAANYNSAADTDDGSCIYLEKIDGNCYAFRDEPPVRDESFTLSWALRENNWVFFHDYIPDFYFNTRSALFSLKNRRIYRHNQGAPGNYYGDPKSFFIDVVFPAEQDVILDAVKWISEVINSQGAEQEFKTLTHITVWNNQQCTGRIALSDVMDVLEYKTNSKLMGEWSLNEFHDALAQRNGQFLGTLFENFQVDPAALATHRAWFDEALMEDRYFVVRLEFDNTSGNRVFLHSAGIEASPSYR